MKPSLMNRAALMACTLSASCVAAIAGTPGALDHVPASTDLVVSISEINDFLGDIDRVNQALGDKAQGQLVFVTAMARGMPGINLKGSAAVLVDFPENPDAETDPDVVILLPVSDFKTFSQQQEPKNGVVELPFPDVSVFARDVGHGYAALAESPEKLSTFKMSEGNMKAHAQRLGGAGNRLVSGAEVTVIVNADTMRPYLDTAKQGMDEQGQMIGMMAGPQAAAGFNMFSAVAGAAMRDLTTGVLGFSINDAGMSYNVAMQFKEGSPSAANFSKGGDTAGLTSRLPEGPYLFAMSFDTSSPAVKNIAKAMDAFKASMPEDMQGGMGMGQLSLSDLSELTDGVAFVMGATPGLMGGGLFANTSQYIKTDSPAKYRQAMLSMMEQANGQSQQGMTISTNVTPDAVTINGTSLTSYGMRFQVDPNAAAAMGGAMPGMDPAMAMQMVFGPAGGPAGYLGEVKNGVIQTLTQGPELTKRAIAAANSGEGLGTNDRMQRVAKALHADRAAEVYIGVDEILNTVGPMLMMFGAIPDFQQVDAIDPVGLALTFDNGGIVGQLHMPMDTFKTIVKMVPNDAGNNRGRGGDDGFDF